MSMRVRWREFELPNRVECEQESSSSSYGKFIIEPFERGFGHTVGNSLRRVLLSSIEGAALVQAKIDGVDHEFATKEGVLEDISHVVLNLKQVLVELPLPLLLVSQLVVQEVVELPLIHDFLHRCVGLPLP